MPRCLSSELSRAEPSSEPFSSPVLQRTPRPARRPNALAVVGDAVPAHADGHDGLKKTRFVTAKRSSCRHAKAGPNCTHGCGCRRVGAVGLGDFQVSRACLSMEAAKRLAGPVWHESLISRSRGLGTAR